MNESRNYQDHAEHDLTVAALQRAVDVPVDVVPRTSRPLRLTPGSVIAVHWPGGLYLDADGTPTAVVPATTTQMTVTRSGALVGWESATPATAAPSPPQECD